MAKHSKRFLEAKKLVDSGKVYELKEAIEILKQMPSAKFDETVEVSCKLNVDPRKSDQMVRGSCVLPHGTGKKIKVLVFCKSDKAKEAIDAGADYAGLEEYIKKIQEGWLDFQYCIASPDVMRDVGKLGKILGPRGLMPSPKTGTVTPNIASAVKQAKQGKVNFKMDKFGVVHVGVGKISFPQQHLEENIRAFLEALIASKPQTAKGVFINSCYICKTMSPSLKINWQNELRQKS